MSGIHKTELSAAFFPKESGNKLSRYTLHVADEVHVLDPRQNHAGMTKVVTSRKAFVLTRCIIETIVEDP